jgi:hypothetical protein
VRPREHQRSRNAQILLNWLLGGGQQTQTIDPQREQRARQAAQKLADRSHRITPAPAPEPRRQPVSTARINLLGDITTATAGGRGTADADPA